MASTCTVDRSLVWKSMIFLLRLLCSAICTAISWDDCSICDPKTSIQIANGPHIVGEEMSVTHSGASSAIVGQFGLHGMLGLNEQVQYIWASKPNPWCPFGPWCHGTAWVGIYTAGSVPGSDVSNGWAYTMWKIEPGGELTIASTVEVPHSTYSPSKDPLPPSYPPVLDPLAPTAAADVVSPLPLLRWVTMR